VASLTPQGSYAAAGDRQGLVRHATMPALD